MSEQFDIKDLGLSNIGEIISVNPVSFIEIGNFAHFKCRMVVKDDKQSGEYHIKPIGIKAAELVSVLNGKLEGIEDMQMLSDNFIDYPIYVKIGSFMTNENIEELLKDIDSYFKGGK